MAYRVLGATAILSTALLIATSAAWFSSRHRNPWNLHRSDTATETEDEMDLRFLNVFSNDGLIRVQFVHSHLDLQHPLVGKDPEPITPAIRQNNKHLMRQEHEILLSDNVPGQRFASFGNRFGTRRPPPPPPSSVWQRFGFDSESRTLKAPTRFSFARWITFPWWVVVCPWMISPVFWMPFLTKRLRTRARVKAGCCANCGYDLRGSGDRCSECGFDREPLPAR
jgi:hypothetical protein